jgi:nucleotide-binding universal stress UspA family protein
MSLPPKTILACTDFSPASDAAVRRAAALAVEHDARLTLLHVLVPSRWQDALHTVRRIAERKDIAIPGPEQAHRVALDRLQRTARALAPDVASTAFEAAEGRPAAEIVRVAHASVADLVVVGAHGAHPVPALLMGTTAQKLLRSAPCPVLVVRRQPPSAYRTVLAPTDLSAASLAAARAVCALLPRAVFHVAHAYELPYEGMLAYAATDEAATQHYRDEAESQLRAELDDFIGRAGFAPGRAIAHVRHGYPPARIDEWTRATGADLVAVAAHGKSAVEALFLGSVSLHVALAATCDVLLVRGAEFDAEAAR